MPVVYRLLRPHEEEQALDLWGRVLDTPADEALQTFRDFHDAPERFQQAHVAVAASGQLLATVCYWLRTVRDSAGGSVRVGHLFHAATEPAARRHGYASRLLAATVDALAERGCRWAILSARQEAVPLYQRAGWQALPRRYWRGTYAPESWQAAQRYPVQPYDPRQSPAGWRALARVYARANARQPGSLIRTAAYWSGYGAWMFGRYLDLYQSLLLVARDPRAAEPIRGYALVNYYDAGFVVSELAADPRDPEVLASLLNGVLAEARARSTPLRGQLTLADDPTARALLRQLFGPTLHSVDDSALHGYIPFMVRPIAHGADGPFTAPAALFWPLDAY